MARWYAPPPPWLRFPSAISTRVGKVDNPAERPQTSVAPKGPSYIFSPWEAQDRARQMDVYTGFVPKGLLSLGGIL